MKIQSASTILSLLCGIGGANVSFSFSILPPMAGRGTTGTTHGDTHGISQGTTQGNGGNGHRPWVGQRMFPSKAVAASSASSTSSASSASSASTSKFHRTQNGSALSYSRKYFDYDSYNSANDSNGNDNSDGSDRKGYYGEASNFFHSNGFNGEDYSYDSYADYGGDDHMASYNDYNDDEYSYNNANNYNSFDGNNSFNGNNFYTNNGSYNSYNNRGKWGESILNRVSSLRGGTDNDRNGNGNHGQTSEYGSLNSLNALSVTELKRILNDRGVDFRDCLEKRDLIERVLQSRALAPSSAPCDSYGHYESRGEQGWQGWQGGRGGANSLSHEENRVVNTFERASPSVAFIQTSSQQQGIQSFGFSLKGTEVPMGTGSGFLWDDRGHIVTNYHVIASATKAKNPVIKVKLQGMPPQLATIVGYEPEKDLAVLRISSRNLPTPISIGSSSDLQVGQNVLAIGNPFGLDYTLTTGVVSALGRDVDGIGGRPIKGCIQSDAAINPGNSGGPLLDSRGRLIGVNMAIYSPSGASAGIGFSIPVDTVRRVVNQIIRHGKVVRPTLGINVADDRLVRSIEMQLRKQLHGVLVVEVLPGSPAEMAGVKSSVLRSDGTIVLGDLITEVNGEKVVSVEDLLSAIETRKEGDVVNVKIWRKCDARLAETVRVKLTTSDKVKSGGRAGTMSSSMASGSAWQ